MEHTNANKVVMTLDAGGTNFVFSAVREEKEIVEPVHLPAHGNDLDKCLRNIIKGFENIQSQLADKPLAISFAFPGPADYARGIIGDLGNLPGFRGGVALGPMLEERFQIPVFINNDGDLFAYGEAMYGLLPAVNQKLKDAGSVKEYHNLVGLTLGTGFGGGLVRQNELFTGDNGAAAEVWLMRNPLHDKTFVEENISIRAITKAYGELCNNPAHNFTPFDIFQIAKGTKQGDKNAALEAFNRFGKALGMALTEIVTIVDGLVVIGGGLANASELFFPAMMQEMNGTFATSDGGTIPRLVSKVFDLQDDSSFQQFATGGSSRIEVPFSSKVIDYDPQKRIAVGVSSLGASKAISLGAYAFAINALGLYD
jgi:glucokinase